MPLISQNFTTLMLRLQSLPDWLRLSQGVQLHSWHTYTHKDYSDDTDLFSEGSQANKDLPTSPKASTLPASDVVLFPCVELHRFLSQIDIPPDFIIFISSGTDLSEKAFSTPNSTTAADGKSKHLLDTNNHLLFWLPAPYAFLQLFFHALFAPFVLSAALWFFSLVLSQVAPGDL